jgi:tRNA threonylcarbamoyladenosine biosynthesis protein TsaB
VVLALDSSTQTLSLALVEWRDGRAKTVASREQLGVAQHGRRLPGAIEELLAEAGQSLDALTGCALGIGPGSFTGLRIGMSTIKGICYARKLPLAGVSSLRALALGVAGGAASDSLFCPLLDARRSEVYAGLFRGPTAEPVKAEAAMLPDALRPWLADATGARVLGEGLHAQREPITRALSDHAQLDFDAPRHPSAVQVAQLAGSPETFDAKTLLSLEPRYVRLSEAEMKFPNGNFTPHPGST